MIDYKKELLNILKNNQISVCPPQELIDSDVEIVLALWENYQPIEYRDDICSFAQWYKDCDWGNKLKKYNEDFLLWEKLLDITKVNSWYGNDTACDFILTEEFKKDFPKVAEYFLTSDERLTLLFQKTHNHHFYDLLKLDLDKKEDILKTMSINANIKIDDDMIKKFESDEKFVEALLQKKPYYFGKLNKENRENQKFIDLAITEVETFEYLSEEKRKENFLGWVTNNIHKIKYNHLFLLNTAQKASIFNLDGRLRISFFSKENPENKAIATMLLAKNFKKFVGEFSDKLIMEIAEDERKLEKIRPEVEKFCDLYIHFGNMKGANKAIHIVRKFKDLEEKLEKNPYYELYVELEEKKEKPTKTNTKDFNWFKDKTVKIINVLEQGKVTKDQCENFLSIARTLLSVEVFKEVRPPKNGIFDFMNSVVLAENLQKNLANQNANRTKNKI